MNILFITKLSGNMWAGPNNSVPAQITAQAKQDNVLWYNINNVTKEEWVKKKFYKNLNDFPSKRICDLPYPFNTPDIVVFEGVYEYPFNSLVYEVWKMKIPYIIVPRSALTEKAQKSSLLKKKIGNVLFFNKFVKKSLAIHYLTNEEYIESNKKWKTKHLVIPNGIASKNNLNKKYNENIIKGIYIGRIEIYQKGLDTLIEACNLVQDELRSARCTIGLYGPDRNNSKSHLNKLINEKNLNDIILIDEGVFDSEKEELQMSSDFFIMTSRFEGHPMGLIEALSYGLPALVTEGTNMKEEITFAEAGWGADSNAQSIAGSLKKMLSEKEKFRLKGQNSYKLSLNYDWDKLANITHEKYLELLKE